MTYIIIIIILVALVVLVSMYNNMKNLELKVADTKRELDAQNKDNIEQIAFGVKYLNSLIDDYNRQIAVPPYNYVSNILGFRTMSHVGEDEGVASIPVSQPQTMQPQSTSSVQTSQPTPAASNPQPDPVAQQPSQTQGSVPPNPSAPQDN